MPTSIIPNVSASERARKHGRMEDSIFEHTNDYLTMAAFKRCCKIFLVVVSMDYVFELLQSLLGSICLGEAALAALGLGFPLYRLIIALKIFILSGSNILGLGAKGKHDTHAVNEIFTLTLILCAIAACIFTPLICLLAPTIASALSPDPEVSWRLSAYLFFIGFSVLPYCVSRTIRDYIILDGDERCATISSLVEMFVSVATLLLCLFVWNVGIVSMAVSTIVGSVANLLVCCPHFFSKKNTLALAKPTQVRQRVKSIFTLSTPEASLVLLKLVLLRSCLNIIVQVFGGTSALAVITIANSVNGVVLVPSGAHERAMSFFGGYLRGKRDALELESTFSGAMKHSAVLTIVLGIIVVALSGYIPSWYAVTDAQTASLLQLTLYALAFSLPFVSLADLYLASLRSVGSSKIATIYGTLTAVLPLPFSCLLVPLLNAPGVFLSYFAASLCIIVIALIVAYRRMRKAGRDYMAIQDILHLPEDFAKTHLESYYLSIPYDRKQAKRIADLLPAVLELAPRDTARLRLCIEELSLNALERSQRKESAKRFFELQIYVDSDCITLTTKDLSRRTNVFTQDELARLSIHEEPGLVIVREICDEVDYQFIRGLNTITVTLTRSD